MEFNKLPRNALATAILMLALSINSQAESARFEVSGNVLIDNQSGLEWQPLILSAGFPDNLQIGDWRVATLSELVDVFPLSFAAEPTTISKTSDISIALDFFAKGQGANCSPSIPDGKCFKGFAYDTGAQAYSPSTMSFGPIPNDLSNIYYNSTTTASAYYSNQFCSQVNIDCSHISMFTVKAIPEPNTLSLLIIGLLGIFYLATDKRRSIVCSQRPLLRAPA